MIAAQFSEKKRVCSTKGKRKKKGERQDSGGVPAFVTDGKSSRSIRCCGVSPREGEPPPSRGEKREAFSRLPRVGGSEEVAGQMAEGKIKEWGGKRGREVSPATAKEWVQTLP